MERSLEQAVADPRYLEFFGLTKPPFGRLPDTNHLFQTEQYSLLMEHLVNATTHTDSLVVICGADGSGKSTLIDRFTSSLDDHIFCVAIDETCHGEVQFYRALLTQIGFEDISGTASELRNITKEFLVCRGIAGDHVLLIIDNAHLTDPIILEQLRWISEIKIKDRRVISVVLTGNADLVHVINAPAMSQIEFGNQVIFNIRNYSREETASYVWHGLRLAGGSDGVKLANEANLLIHRYSGGIPRQINTLCNEMLAEACRLETRVISEGVVRTVADKQGLLPHVVPLHGKGRRKTDPDFEHVKAVPKMGETASGAAVQTSKSKGDSVPARADVGPEELLKYVSKLAVQIEDLRADKVRALQDIDARNNDIVALRKQLDAQVEEVEKLTRSLTIDAEEVTQQNLALSTSAAALQDSESKSKQLAADLDEEVRAKEVAQNELAEATATVQELNQLKQELQATVDDVQAECDSAQQRIAALKNPQELEEIQKASDQFAADLRKEKRARKAAEKELAKATATVEELNQQKRELQATVDDVQADLEAGLKVGGERAVEIEALEKNTADLKEEIEGKTGELDSLRDELASRNEILTDLEMRLDQSQSACELAQQRIVVLKSPEELEEIERASDKLAADLEKETRAREAAEKDLAKATAKVEELSHRKSEMQATFDDVQADLEVADERAAEIEALKKNATDLKDEIEGKTGELDSLRDELKSLRDALASRNEAVADLETQLGESQTKCESAQQRITALKDPEELEEIERASDNLAADLKQEKRARKAAEKDLAKATATVEQLSLLERELKATVDDVQADLKVADERAVEIEALEKHRLNLNDELEGKTGELDSLRDELKSLRDRLTSRDKDVADLERWLQESQKERAAAQLRMNALKDPEELEEVERASGKLAADLRKETRAREAAEKELAKATATVEELNRLKQELKATVRDLNADLRVTGERAVDAYVLERKVTDLREELDKRTRVLDSRDQTLADLEKQLEASQNECALLRRRAPAAKTGKKIIAKQAIPASGRDARVYSSHVVAKFEQSLSNIPAYQTLRQYDPAFYDGLIITYKQLVGLDLTDKQVNDALRAKQAKLMEQLLPGVADEAIIAYARLIVDQLDELRLDGTEPCLSLLIPQSSPDNTSSIYSETTKGRELDTLDIVLRTYDADRQLPAEKDVWPDLGPIFEELFEEFGADNVAAMENSYDPGVDRGLVCNVTRALYSGILNLPERNAANALRWLLST